MKNKFVKIKSCILASLVFAAPISGFAGDYSVYTGLIKRIYLHERDTSPYFGVEVEGEMDVNHCGNPSKRTFVTDPDTLSERMYSMILSAHVAGLEVKLANYHETDRCKSGYPTIHYVEIP